MKKTIFQCIGNALLFTLIGLAFSFPFSEITQTEFGFKGTLTIYPLLLVAYLIIYPIIYCIFSKKFHWTKKDNSELTFSDEREKTIVAESTKIAYKVLIGGLMLTIALIGGIKFFLMFTGMNISIYSISIILIAALLDVSSIIYCIKWCLEYKK